MAHYENLSQKLFQFDNKFSIKYVIIFIFTVHRSSLGTDSEKKETLRMPISPSIMEIAKYFLIDSDW